MNIPACEVGMIAMEITDIDDAEAFPNIARAHEWFASLSDVRRAELDAEWA